MGFPGARADHGDAAYVLHGAPLDVSTSFRPGARFGPREVRHAAEPFEDYDHRTDRNFSDLGVHDAGDLDAWNDVDEYLEFLAGSLSDTVAGGGVPLLVGGEHTVSTAGVRATRPDVYVCLDAHLDLREEYMGDSLSHATATRRVLEHADRAVILGARAGSAEEWERADHDDVAVVPPEAVEEWSPDLDGSVYLSVDIDAADPGFAPGTGTPEPFGLAPRDLREVVRAVAPDCVGFDVVEITDRDDGQAPALGAKLLREFVFTHASRTGD